jgi:flagellar motor switch protein FliN
MSLDQQQSDQLKKQVQALLEGAKSALGDTISQTVTVTSSPDIVFADGWEGVPDHFEDEGPLMATLLLNEPYESLCCLLLKNDQAKIVGDYMMGGAGVAEPGPVSDMQLSALGEALNQMFNGAATALSECVTKAASFDSPQVSVFSQDQWQEQFPLWGSEPLISVHGNWTIAAADLKEDIDFVFVMEEALAKRLVEHYQDPPEEPDAEAMAAMNDLASLVMNRAASLPTPSPGTAEGAANAPSATPISAVGGSVSGGGSSGGGAGGSPMDVAASSVAVATKPVTVAPVSFGTFDQQPNVVGEENRNLSLLLDIRLNLTVELGRTKLPIKDVLELTRGSIVELERVAGEPVDLFANGKLIARGEVVVIEDNFGLRITSIVSPADRLRSL